MDFVVIQDSDLKSTQSVVFQQSLGQNPQKPPNIYKIHGFQLKIHGFVDFVDFEDSDLNSAEKPQIISQNLQILWIKSFLQILT